MKPYLILVCLLDLLACKASAQTRITAAEASKHIGENVYVCDTVHSMKYAHDPNTTSLILGDKRLGGQLTIVIKGFNLDTKDYYKGQTVCVVGVVASHKWKPEIELTDSEMISVRKVSILGRTDNSEHQKATLRVITKVQLTPPPHAHYFGDGYTAIGLKEVDRESADTIKVTETISDYKVTDTIARIDVGGVYPYQKLSVVLKGQAKKYLDAMLEIEYKGKTLLGMRVIAIGKITLLEGKPHIVIANPNLFTIIDH